MRYFIGLILLVGSLQSFSQVINERGNVEMPLSTYRIMTDHWYACDSAVIYRDQIIAEKDTTITNKNVQIQSLNETLAQKDLTTAGVRKVAEDAVKKQKKPFINPQIWVAFSTGLSAGVIIVLTAIH